MTRVLLCGSGVFTNESVDFHTCPWDACDERVSHRNARERPIPRSLVHPVVSATA